MGQGEEAGRAPSQASQAGMSVSGRLVKAKTAVLTAEEAVTREGTGRRERGIPRSSPQLASPPDPKPHENTQNERTSQDPGTPSLCDRTVGRSWSEVSDAPHQPLQRSGPPSGQPWRGRVRGGPPTGLAVSS